MDRTVGISRNGLYWSFIFVLAFFIIASVTATRSQAYAAEPVDTEPPTSNVSFLGDWNGYYFETYVEVSISATDAPSGQSQNVKYTAYRINSGTWSPYTEPFIIQQEGISTISYYSEDYAGNPEHVKTAQFEINSNTPTPTPAPTQSVFVSSTPTPTLIASPTTTQETVSPSVIPAKSAANTGQAYPASYPYYRSPTKTTTPTPKRVTVVSFNRPTTAIPSSPSPTPERELVQNSAKVQQTESTDILGQWDKVRTEYKPASEKPWLQLILALGILFGYLGMMFYFYQKLRFS